MNNKRHLTQWLLLSIVFIVIGLGWKYRWLGFLVPLVMLIGIIGAFMNGRYLCGNFCPRGAFFDRLIAKISPQRTIPFFLRNMTFRWIILILLMGLMILQLSREVSWQHWGLVFWLMCTVTTLLGIVLALFFRARTWCAFCPIGTIGKIASNHKNSLKIEAQKCVSCKLCERVCPMGLTIVGEHKNYLCNNDCIKCLACVNRCPRQALSN